MKNTETEKEVLRLIRSRWKLGRKRYNEGISHHQSNDPINWITQALEECSDQLQYLVALKLLLIDQMNIKKVKKVKNNTEWDR